MGWAFCGTNRHGQEIGYGVEATCDEPGCDAKIDRGLSYACGDMHDCGETCGQYYCEAHLSTGRLPGDERNVQMCRRCAALYDDEDGWIDWNGAFIYEHFDAWIDSLGRQMRGD